MQQSKPPRERAKDLIRLLVPDWRPTPRQGLWAIRIGIVLGILIAIGYSYGITLWDWAQLLIVPTALAGGVAWLDWAQRHRERKAEEAARERERKAEATQRERQLEVANQRAQDEAFQAFLDQIGQLLLDKERPLRESKVGDEARILARARTLTVLARLDRGRKVSVIQFLYESGLIDGHSRIIDLRGADLSGVSLSEDDLSEADLSDANLSGTDLSGTDLSETNLSGTDLSGAVLYGANLSDANLREANLGWTNLRASLGCTEKQLSAATTLESTIMPDGQILRGREMPHGVKDKIGHWFPLVYPSSFDGPTFEDWLKRHGSGESGRNLRGF